MTGKHPEDIKAAIRKRHGTIEAFELENGLSRRSVKDVLRGRSSPRTARAIADLVGKPPHVLFPDRFAPNGDALSKRGASLHRQNAGAE